MIENRLTHCCSQRDRTLHPQLEGIGTVAEALWRFPATVGW
jgi:hypothetical protein